MLRWLAKHRIGCECSPVYFAQAHQESISLPESVSPHARTGLPPLHALGVQTHSWPCSSPAQAWTEINSPDSLGLESQVLSAVASGKTIHRRRLQEVEVRGIDIATNFRDFDDYWSPFLGGQGPAPSYTMSLSEGRREALRERVRSSLPIARNGSIPLIARAWAVRGARHTLACSPKHGI